MHYDWNATQYFRRMHWRRVPNYQRQHGNGLHHHHNNEKQIQLANQTFLPAFSKLLHTFHQDSSIDDCPNLFDTQMVYRVRASFDA